MIHKSGSSLATTVVLCLGEMTEAWTGGGGGEGRWRERGEVRPDKTADR